MQGESRPQAARRFGGLADLRSASAAHCAAGPAAGFFRCAGYWIVNGTSNRYGDADKGYLISCEATAERSGCLVYSTTTDPVTGEVPLGYGLSVRCVKDDAVR